jgi:hypothetical protein
MERAGEITDADSPIGLFMRSRGGSRDTRPCLSTSPFLV